MKTSGIDSRAHLERISCRYVNAATSFAVVQVLVEKRSIYRRLVHRLVVQMPPVARLQLIQP